MRETQKAASSNATTTSKTDTENVNKEGLKLLQQLIEDPNLTQERRRVILSETLVRVNQQIGTPLILAALNNLTKVVELLLKNELVDLEQTCTIELDEGRRAEGVTALWAASYANHLDIVKLLVLNGADPNHATRSNSTPLRTACFHGWNEVVLCLVNYGADVNSTNSQGSTCLMAAAYNGHRDTVTVLVNRNADLNTKDSKGNTALHYAAERGNLSVVKMLVKLDAKILVNDDGLTPLKLACNACQDDVMKFFVLRPQTTRYEIIEALELLGATYANHPTKNNTEKAYKLLWTAMVHRFNDPEGDVLHKFVRPPVRAYGYRFECQTPEELEAIKNNASAIHMEGLIVRERLLRTWNLSVPLHIRYRGACLADGGNYNEALELWKYAARLDQKNGNDCLEQLFRIAKLMSQMVRKGKLPEFAKIEELFILLLTEMEQLRNGNEERGKKARFDLEKELKFEEAQLSALIYSAIVLQLDLSRKEQRRFMKDIKKFLSLEKEISQGGNTLLHLAVSRDVFRNDKKINQVCRLPSTEVVRLLIDAGANPDATNRKGCTPLHLIASFTSQDADSKRASTSSAQIDIIQDLLTAGASPDVENEDMLTPVEYAQLDQIKNLISTFATDNLS